MVWLRLPSGMGQSGSIITLIAGVMIGAEMLMSLLANDRHRWLWSVGLLAASLQIAISASSLWALRIQKKRAR